MPSQEKSKEILCRLVEALLPVPVRQGLVLASWCVPRPKLWQTLPHLVEFVRMLPCDYNWCVRKAVGVNRVLLVASMPHPITVPSILAVPAPQLLLLIPPDLKRGERYCLSPCRVPGFPHGESVLSRSHPDRMSLSLKSRAILQSLP